MATGANPFSRIVSAKQAAADRAAEAHHASKATPVENQAVSAAREAAAQRADELAKDQLRQSDHQATTGTRPDPDHTPPPEHNGTDTSSNDHNGAPGHGFDTDMPAALTAARDAANAELSKLEDAAGTHDPAGAGSSAPPSLEDRLHQAAGAFSPGQATRDAAKDPEDHGKGGDPVGTDVRAALHDRGEPGSDALTSALIGLGNEAASQHNTSPVNAQDALSDAQQVSPADLAAAAAKAGVTPPTSPPPATAPAATPPPAAAPAAAPDTGFLATFHEKGFVAAVTQFIAAPVQHAAENSAAAADEASGVKSTNPSTTTVGQAQQALGIKNLESGFVPQGSTTPGVKLTDPNSDDPALTPARLAFVNAINQITHTGPAFHNPGFVDPGRDGDQTGTQTGPVSDATIADHSALTLLGNPGSASAETSVGGHVTPGSGAGVVVGQHDSSGLDPQGPQGDFNTGPGNATAKDDGPGSEHLGPSGSLGASTATGSGAGSDDDNKDSSDTSGTTIAFPPELVSEVERFHVPDHLTTTSDADDS